MAQASDVGCDNEEIIRQLYVAGEQPGLDPDKFVSFFSEEGYMWDMASGTKFRGKDIGKSITALAKAFPDVRREIQDIYAAGDAVVVEHRIRGTHDGELALGSKTVPPTGKAIDVPCADIFRLKNGKIVAFSCYNLPSVMQQQLGLADS
ncbi:MAG TPA: nuclear transport factor 2 family protein [Verrucomicrobiae bacterium]|nr:nuclear transport factor 2 family protein [Verrucomicrobiae bacterium]